MQFFVDFKMVVVDVDIDLFDAIANANEVGLLLLACIRTTPVSGVGVLDFV